MSSPTLFNQQENTNFFVMENIFHIADCCRSCLRIECSLTPTSTLDTDNIKICDKLNACVSEVAWTKEGLPSLICSTCIERLRVAYDFKTVCLQSDQTLLKYVNHLQHESKECHLNEQEFVPSAKYDISTSQGNIPCLVESESQNAEFLHLKHFLDNDEDLTKSDSLTARVISRSDSPETNEIVGTFLQQSSHELPSFNHDVLQLENQINQPEPVSNSNSSQNQQINHHQFEDLMPQPEEEPNQIRQLFEKENQIKTDSKCSTIIKHKIMRTMGVQVRPPTPSSVKNDGKNCKIFTCTICGKSYRKNANLRVHMRIHTGEKPFECKYCDKRFYHSSHLREHIRRHKGEKPFQCALCNKRFTIRGELTMHMKSHTGEKPYACTCCNRRCLTAADLKLHMRIHTGEKPFECTTCGRYFASTYILNAHLKTHTGERPFSCIECSKTFTQSSHLQVHMRKHTGEKINCKICDAQFSYSSQLTIHMREHTGKQPYKCSLCDKNCKYASEYEAHMRKHTGEKFSCNICDKKFMTASYLQEHNRTHTGQNLSTCTICDRQFTRPTYLEKHMRTHTGEKPYTCLMCGKKFTQSSSLKVHLRIHTGEKPFHCQICDKRFTTSSDLSSHNKKHDKKYITL